MLQAKRLALLAPRLLTSPMRALPDFVIIGAQKGGTTSLYNYLAEHPDVAPASVKETHFFDGDYGKGKFWYRAQFPTSREKRRAGDTGKVITGEATPYYLFHPLAARRVAKMIPHAKLIVLLRDPVDRAYSHYHHERHYELEDLSFEEAIEREPERLAGEREKMLAGNYHSFNHMNYSYLSRGIYVDQLREWRNYFPEEQLLILRSEDLFTNTPAVMEHVSNFLGLPFVDHKGYKKLREGRYPEINAATERYLVDYFRPHNERLYEYLDRDFGWKR